MITVLIITNVLTVIALIFFIVKSNIHRAATLAILTGLKETIIFAAAAMEYVKPNKKADIVDWLRMTDDREKLVELIVCKDFEEADKLIMKLKNNCTNDEVPWLGVYKEDLNKVRNSG